MLLHPLKLFKVIRLALLFIKSLCRIQMWDYFSPITFNLNSNDIKFFTRKTALHMNETITIKGFFNSSEIF